MSNEANTCRKYVEPRLEDAGWNTEPHDYTENYYFTNGKIRPKNQRQPRGKSKFADYLLLYNLFAVIQRRISRGVVEAKGKRKTPNEGLEQAIDYLYLLGKVL